MIEYKLIQVLSPEIVGLYSDEYGKQLWAVANLTKKHKDDRCPICDLKVGDRAYRPTTNKSNRMKRICIPCIESIKPAVSIGRKG